MFRIVSQRMAWWPVLFAGVTEDGKVIENKIELRFVILDEEEIDPFSQRLEKLTKTAVEEGRKVSADETANLMCEVVKDWRGVAGANGEPLPFSAENFALLLKVPNAATAVGTAYRHCRAGVPEQREGN